MSRYRILLADDEQIERTTPAKRLNRHFGDSLDISEAVNGAEALEVFGKEQSQIAIMDISMPEMNGVEAAERVRSMDENCIIISLTAHNDFIYAKRVIIVCALDYLLKSYDEEESVSVTEEATRLTDHREGQKQTMEAGRVGGGAVDELAGGVAGETAGASVGRLSGGATVGSPGGVPGGHAGG